MTRASQARARLKAASWLRMEPLRLVFATLDGNKDVTRVVGGAVRDTLLGHSGDVTEVDLATMLLPEEVTARAEAKGIAAIPTGIAFGTVTLVLGKHSYEVTTLRHDVETDGRRAVVRFGSDWAEDAERRDFTLNALYCGPDGQLFDPLDGLKDCLAGRVRFIGDAAARIKEDRLRIFRFFRFSASHGGENFDAAGLKASAAAAHDLGPISAERIGHEMTRILGLPKCAKTLARMGEVGILDIDAATLASLRRYEDLRTPPSLVGRLAILAGSAGPEALKTRWRLSNALVKEVEATGRAAQLIAANRLAEAAYRFPDLLEAGLDIAATTANWPRAQSVSVWTKLLSYAPPPFPVSGALLLRHGFVPGPALGVLITRLETAWIDSEFTLTQAQLLELARADRP